MAILKLEPVINLTAQDFLASHVWEAGEGEISHVEAQQDNVVMLQTHMRKLHIKDGDAPLIAYHIVKLIGLGWKFRPTHTKGVAMARVCLLPTVGGVDAFPGLGAVLYSGGRIRLEPVADFISLEEAAFRDGFALCPAGTELKDREGVSHEVIGWKNVDGNTKLFLRCWTPGEGWLDDSETPPIVQFKVNQKV